MGLLGVIFFFQAEDGIRDGRVTGVQTCALPISLARRMDKLGPPRMNRPVCRKNRVSEPYGQSICGRLPEGWQNSDSAPEQSLDTLQAHSVAPSSDVNARARRD